MRTGTSEIRYRSAEGRTHKAKAVLLSLAAGLVFFASGQIRLDYLAAGSPNGIFVMLGARVAGKGQALSGYRIERRPAGTTAWQQLADVAGPASLTEFRARVEKARDLSPEPVDLKALPVERIWQDITRAGNVDSLRFPGQLLEVRLALGLLYVDRTAEQNRDYEYRVSELDAAGAARPVLVSGKAHWPFAVPFAPMHLTSARADERSVNITWQSVGKMRGCSFRILRDEGQSGRFEPVAGQRIVANSGDTTTYSFSDTAVVNERVYRYYAVPFCRYGNAGPTTETTMVATYRFRNISLPSNLAAESTNSGLHLRWQLAQPSLVKSLRIYRSEQWDTGYTRVAEVPPAATGWLDATVMPNVKYYYYLEMTGFLDEVSPRSARFFGMYQNPEPPLAPYALFADPLDRGVRLRWDLSETDVAGTYVYRRDPMSGGFSQISDLIPAATTTYDDTGFGLSPLYQYGYVVRAISTSKVLGPASETAYARPHGEVRPSVPLNFTAVWADGAVRLYWDDMRPGNPALAGYWLLRRTGTGRFTRLLDSLLPGRRNYYTDTTAQPGTSYEYLVVAASLTGPTSDSAARAVVAIPRPIPAAPAGLRGRPVSGGIELTWNAPFGPEVTGYRVYRYVRGSNPARVAQLNASTESWTDAGAAKGVLYFYYLTALGTAGAESGPGAEVGIRR